MLNARSYGLQQAAELSAEGNVFLPLAEKSSPFVCARVCGCTYNSPREAFVLSLWA